MVTTTYTPDTGVVTIDGKQYTQPVHLRKGEHRIKTTTPVINYLVEKGYFRDRVAAGRAIRAAKSFKLSNILSPNQKIVIAKNDGFFELTHKGETRSYKTLRNLMESLEEKLAGWIEDEAP